MNPHVESMFSGVLPADSPGLTADLHRSFDQKAVRYLMGCYHESACWGGLRENPVERKHGVSYNPRPARITQILLKETPRVSVFSASVALFSTVPEAFHSQLHTMYSKQQGALKSLDALETCDELLQNVVFARTLDSARHLHLTSLSMNERAEVFRMIRQKIDYWVTAFRSDENQGLFTLLEQWAELTAAKFPLPSAQA